jgi:AcrR family transcriptional regulator
MPRWEAGTDGRLAEAAYRLYLERGFEDVTVAEIAERAGLTKRTFFRHFADKREVLFAGAPAFQEAVVTAVVDAPEGVAPIDAVIGALAIGGTGLTAMGERARQRQRLVDASPELQEREMIKMAALTSAISGGLARRGVPDHEADLTAQAGVAVFTTAFERWAAEEGPAEFTPIVHRVLDELRAAVGSRPHRGGTGHGSAEPGGTEPGGTEPGGTEPGSAESERG